MQTPTESIRRPLRALLTLLLCIAALWAMLRNARALLLYVGQLTRSAIESRPAALSGIFTANRKPAKSEMSVELGMIPVLLDRMASLLCLLSAGALLGCATAVANPISVSNLTLRHDYIGPNDLVFLPMGDVIELSASVTPNGSAGTTVTAQTTDLSTGLLTSPIVIPFGPSTVLPNFFIRNIPYQSNLTGPWTVTFTNDVNTANTTILITPSIVGVAPAPTPINVTESGSSLNPTFTWSYPTSVDSVTVLIFEKNIQVDPTGNLVPGGFDLVFAQSLPGATNSFTLPTVLASGFTLTPGISYVVDILSNILRDPTGPSTGANVEALTHTFFDFTPTSTAPLPPAIYLPTIGPNGVYNFNLTVQPNATYNIDPPVATGFVYATGAGNPNFATVVLPNLQGSEPYTISWDNGREAKQVLGGDIFNFLQTDPLGVSTFTVTGIDPADALNPTSGTEFVTGLTFVGGGSFTGTMTPITTTLPIANAGPNQTAQVGTLVTLDGSASSDPTGQLPLTYAWSFVSKPAGSTVTLSNPAIVNPTFTPDALGNYVIQLVVTDGAGLSSAPATVTISTKDAPPVADAGPNQTITAVGTLVQLNGSASYDLAGLPITYQWSFVSKPTGSSATLTGPTTSNPTTSKPSFLADVAGNYILQLVVTDSVGTASSPAEVTVSFSDVPPVANVSANPSSTVVGGSVTLNGSKSTDTDGAPLTYQWSIVSAPSGSTTAISNPTAQIASLVPDLPGTFVVQLIVNEGFLNSLPATAEIEVVSQQTQVTQNIQSLQSTIAGLPPSAFKHPRLQNDLIKKLNAVIRSISPHKYARALQQLQNDILTKVDGCATTGAPDKKDWVMNCPDQSEVYPQLLNIIAEVKALCGC